MDTLTGLLDKARATCSPPSDIALAAKLHVSRQSVHEWRTGAKRISDDKLAQLIDAAHAPASVALVIHSEQAKTPTEKKLWVSLAKQLGVAAALALVTLSTLPARANPEAAGTRHYAQWWKALVSKLVAVMNRPNWNADHAPTPMLA